MSRKINNPEWEAGYNAYFSGKTRDDNPYLEDSQSFENWEDGWDCADSDSDDN